jgi:broad specificity phosphatase PhoE
MADFDKVAPPGGESFQQLQARVISAISSQLTSPQRGTPEGHTFVVTHAGVIRAAVSAFSTQPLRRAFEYAVPYGALTSFYWNGTHLSVADGTGLRRTLLRAS